MKKIIYMTLICVLAITCNNTYAKGKNFYSNETQKIYDNFVNPQPVCTVVGVRGGFSFDGWGNKKHNCHGGGLCNFRWEKWEVHSDGYMGLSLLEGDNNDNYTVKVFINDAYPILEIDNFEISEDISLTDDDGTIITLKAGHYPFNSHIGTSGGFIVKVNIN